MSFSAQTLPNDNGYAWYQCTCCPYGYHIDLDFVRYCESIGQQVERTGSLKIRKDRRRQRQSMEVLLGLTAPLIVNQTEPPLPTIQDMPRSPLIQDALDDAVSDFERTLQRSKNKLSNNLPDVTAVSGDVAVNRDYDAVSIESCGHSPANLQNIREQMALSLERTKELEKLVPSLQAQLADLKEENKHLLMQLQSEEDSKLNRLNSNYLINPYNSFQVSDVVDDAGKSQPPPPPPRRDFGVMAGVLTRNVGVGHQTPHTKTVSTATQQDQQQHVDRWFAEKNKFLNGPSYNTLPEPNKISITKGTQTIFSKEKRDVSLQTAVSHTKITTRDVASQAAEPKKSFNNTGSNTYTQISHIAVQCFPDVISKGISEDTIDEIFCPKCNAARSTIAVGTSDMFNDNQIQQPISLAALSVPRSKSFHLGQEKLNMTRSRTVGSQYEALYTSNKSSQYELKMQSKHSQHEITLMNKSVQFENTGQSKSTDTAGLKPAMKHKACECREIKAETAEVACNTQFAAKETKETPCAKCAKDKDDETAKREEPTTPSRIPRPQIPTTPVENRKFKRQDTYTKIPAPEKTPLGLSALELVLPKTIPAEPTTQFEKVKQKYKLPEAPKGAYNGHDQSFEDDKKPTQPTVSESTLCQPPSPRKKCIPTKEMQAAMKVLNDSIQKNHGRDVRGQMKNAIGIIEAEWFKVSSTVKADPVDVEDYLDSFEDISANLLEHVVNMVDASGNTAMHYAVSHGNFDVVSILLDSKVCDINKQNKAGYTSVMLVSLAEVRSQTHANVVRRLFSLADVNIRAKQHGQTALMLAVSHGRLDMVSMLLEAGADINIQDEDGSTALMCAAEHGHVDIVKHFLSQPDCDSNISDVDGSTALKIAMEAGHRHIGVLLYAHERNIHGNAPVRPKKSKSCSASPKTPSSPLMQRSVNRALSNK